MISDQQPMKRSQSHEHADDGDHGHRHGVVDPKITTTRRDIWAVKRSFAALLLTALLQLLVVALSGSVALLADTLHSVGDALTALPLWIVFNLGRRQPTRRYTHGLGRLEDLAGVFIVLVIAASAIAADLSVAEAHKISQNARHAILHQLPFLSQAVIHIDPQDSSGEAYHRIEAHAHDGRKSHGHP
jgi:divalent metal cation (Fe/Co/Zn/Cd) transporter